MARIVAAALAERHDVTVLCGRPSYDPPERRPWRPWRSERMDRLRVIRVGSTDYPRFAMKLRVLNYLTYVAFAVPCALFLPCDVVLAMTDPPFEGIVGAFVAMLKRKPFVYNIRDLYPDMAVAGSIVEPGLLSRVWERLHRWALRRATRVIALGEDMKARMVRKGVSPARIAVVRDGADIYRSDAAEPAAPGTRCSRAPANSPAMAPLSSSSETERSAPHCKPRRAGFTTSAFWIFSLRARFRPCFPQPMLTSLP